MQLRKANCKDNNTIRMLWEECFPEDSDAWRDWYFQFIYKPDNTFALFENEVPVSMAQINEYSMVINNNQVKAYALSGVSTLEKFRRQGYADILIKAAVKEMYNRGGAFSFLYPFNYNFYYPYGYAESYSTHTIKKEPDNDIDTSLILEKSYSLDDLVRLYKEYARNFNGYVFRDKDYFEMKLKEYLGDGYIIELVYDHDIIIAYYIGKPENDVFKLDELICIKNLDVILSAIANNKHMKVEASIASGQYNHEQTPFCMGRVVNFKKLFTGIKCNQCELKIRIIDEIIDGNAGVWNLYGNDGHLQVERSSGHYELEVQICDLAPLATGANGYMTESVIVINNALFGGQNRIPWIIEVC